VDASITSRPFARTCSNEVFTRRISAFINGENPPPSISHPTPKIGFLVGPEKGTLRYHRQKLIPGCRDEQGTQEVE
jgi:hypothetical protein